MQPKSKILDLLYGKFDYADRIKPDAECQKVINEFLDAAIELSEKIKDYIDLKELYEKFVDCEGAKAVAETDLYYTAGFKTGLLIGIEAGEWAGEKD